jgi:hypothetical protein
MDRGASGPFDTRMFLVERYWPGIDEPGARAVVASLESAARTMSAEGSPIEHVGSILMPADQVVFSLITAVDEAAVRALNARADVPLDRIAAAIGLGIGDSKGDR